MKKKCKQKLFALRNKRAALLKELTKDQQIIAEGTSKQLDETQSQEAWEILTRLTGLTEEEILARLSQSQPKPLKWWETLGMWCQIFWKKIISLACFVAYIVKILDYFNIEPK